MKQLPSMTFLSAIKCNPIQVALQQMADKESQQATQNEDQQQGEPEREGDQLVAKFHAHTLKRQDAAQ